MKKIVVPATESSLSTTANGIAKQAAVVGLPTTNGNHLPMSPQSEAGKRVSEDEYWAHYYQHPDFNYEWNNGILEVKPVSDLAQLAQFGWIHRLTGNFLEIHPIATMAVFEFGVRIELDDKTVVRKPDLMVVRNDNRIPLRASDRSYRGVCDLCIEALSDEDKDDIERDTVHKKKEYAEAGVKEYFILDVKGKHLAFYRLDANGEYQPIPVEEGGVIRSEVLPGFQFRKRHLDLQPIQNELVEDPVYSSFVLPIYQVVKQRAEQAELLVETERRRAKAAEASAAKAAQRTQQAELVAEQERLRSAKMAEMLRSLGIDPP